MGRTAKKPLERVVDVEELKIYSHQGGKYVVLSRLAEVMGTKKPYIYNTAARLKQELQDMYVKKIETDEIERKQPYRCIEVHGVIHVLRRLEKHIDEERAKAVLNFIYEVTGDRSIYSLELVEITPSKPVKESKIVEVEARDTSNEVTNEVNNVRNVEDIIVEVEINKVPKEAVIENVQIEEEFKFSNMDSLNTLLEGISNVLMEHKTFKDEIPALKAEIQKLKIENLDLKSKIERNSVSPEKVIMYEDKIKSLQSELMASKRALETIMGKANQIKQYIMGNK